MILIFVVAATFYSTSDVTVVHNEVVPHPTPDGGSAHGTEAPEPSRAKVTGWHRVERERYRRKIVDED